ncbi:MAG TPA: vWA domain-containing protein [Thermoleophilia bacterium]|nr:vWA domain-containing protein [Thermoleophilia bacterium]
MAAGGRSVAPPWRLPPEPLPDADAHVLLAARLDVEPEAVDGWTVATRLSDTSFALGDRRLKAYAQRIATAAVLRRAWRLVGPLRRATRPVLEIMEEPFRGELEVEATLENVAGKRFPEHDDWIVERREDTEQQLVLMMDASLSMAGENLAIAAVAAAVLALKMRSEDLSVVVFESVARVVSRLEERDDPEQIVARLLAEPARGYTNIEAGLRLGGREIGRGRNPRKAGLLITDGVSTAGGDPVPAADAFPRLHVLLTEDYKMDPALCERLASIGRGEVFRVRHHAELPAKMLDIANRVLR